MSITEDAPHLESFFSHLVQFSEQDNHLLHLLGCQQPHPPAIPSSQSTLTYSPLKPEVDASSYTNASDHEKSTNGDPEPKRKSRRANQNIASRNYRQRKKEYLSSLEAKIAHLTLENEQLRRENASIKQTGGVEMMRTDPTVVTFIIELRHTITRLQHALKNGADDETLGSLLQMFHLNLAKRHAGVEHEVEKILHPYTQAKLALLGYVPVMEHPVTSVFSAPESNGWWNRYAQEAKITEGQWNSLKLLREKHWQNDLETRKERRLLDQFIKDFLQRNILTMPSNEHIVKHLSDPFPLSPPHSDSVIGVGEADIAEIIEFTRKLEALKRNFVAQRTLIAQAHVQMNKILSPRQEAMLLVRMYDNTRYDTCNMEMLKNVWNSVGAKGSQSVRQPGGLAAEILSSSTPTPSLPMPSYPHVTSLPPSIPLTSPLFHQQAAFPPTSVPQISAPIASFYRLV